MDAAGPAAAIYFVALMTIGNYVLFNLLVAILVEGFQTEVRLLVAVCVSNMKAIKKFLVCPLPVYHLSDCIC